MCKESSGVGDACKILMCNFNISSYLFTPAACCHLVSDLITDCGGAWLH